MKVTKQFIDSLMQPRILVDFSNERIDANTVLLSNKDEVIDNHGNKIALFEGLKVYAYEENQEWGEETRDDIIANGICVKNNGDVYRYCKWLMQIDENGLHYMSEFKKD